MILYLRKLRRELIKGNRFSKYLLYAIGEILLVVIGILIALQVNNWNETRKLSQSEQEFFEGIRSDMIEDRNYIDRVLQGMKPKKTAYEQLNSEFPAIYHQDRKRNDSLLGIYLFNGQQTFYPVSGTFQSSLSENRLNTYKDKQLIRPIIKLYQSTYSRLADNANILDDRWGQLSKNYIHARRAGNFNEMNLQQTGRTLDDIHFHYLQMIWYMNVLQETRAEIDTLIGKLETKQNPHEQTP